MSFVPAVPWAWLLAVGVILMVARVVALTAQRRRRVLRWGGLTAAVLLFLVAAARPGLDTGRDVAIALDAPASASADLNVFFVVDRSVDSPVPEMRADIAGLIDEYPAARFALISFATRATVDWPLSDDVWGLESFVAGLSPYSSANPASANPASALQTNAFAARDVLRAKVDAANDVYSGSRNVVFYLGAGAPDSVVSRGSFDIPAGTVAGGAVLGYADSDMSRLEEIAGQLGVPYVQRSSGQPIADAVPAVEAGASAGAGSSLQVTERRELYWVFTSLVVALLLVEIALTIREYRRNRMSRRDVRI